MSRVGFVGNEKGPLAREFKGALVKGGALLEGILGVHLF